MYDPIKSFKREVNLEGGELELGEPRWTWRKLNLEGGCEPWRKVVLDNDDYWSLGMSRLKRSRVPSSYKTPNKFSLAEQGRCILLLPERGELLPFWKDRMLAKKVEESVCSSQSQLCSLPGHLWKKCPLPQDSHTLQVKSPNIRISLKIWFDFHLSARKRSGSGSSFTRKLGLREVEMGARFTFLMANSWGGLS